MKSFAVFAALIAAASSQIIYNGLGNIGYGYSGLGGLTYAASPVHAYAGPQIVASPVATKSQYHSQDELGQAAFGHSEPTQNHHAVRDAAGNVRGTFSYASPDGRILTSHYTAGHNGYNVLSNAVPVAPSVSVVGPVDTPEVANAKAQHFAAVAEAQARSGRKKRGIISPVAYSSQVVHSNVFGAPALTYAAPAYTPAVHSYAYSAAVPAVQTYSAAIPAVQTYSAAIPAVTVAHQNVRHATLTKVVNSPGHAVSYRVD